MDPIRENTHIGPTAAGKTLDDGEKARLQKAAREFEAMFVAYMFKSMRATVPKSEMLDEGFGGDMMDSLLDIELGRQLARTSSLGLGEMMYRKITGEQLPKATPVSPREYPRVSPISASPTPVAEPQHTAPVPSAPVRLKIRHTVAERVNTYTPIIREAAEKHGVDENLLKAVIATESAGNPRARSAADAKGLMQLIDSTAQSVGVTNIWNPRDNIMGGAKYLGQMMARFSGNVERALASYNAGPGAVEKHGGIPPFRETQAYVGRVMEYLKAFAQQQEPDNDEE